MLWFKGLPNTIYCDTLRFTSYHSYQDVNERLAR